MDIRRTLSERAGPCDTALGKDCRRGKNIAGLKRKNGMGEMLSRLEAEGVQAEDRRLKAGVRSSEHFDLQPLEF
jgi:hypothetical protein